MRQLRGHREAPVHIGRYWKRFRARVAGALSRDVDPYVRRVVEPFFDEAYYLYSYPDIASTGMEPLTHYLTLGWRENRNPNSDFDTAYYVETYPDVVVAGLNPLFHYLVSGIEEGRLPQPPRPQSVPLLPKSDVPFVSPSGGGDQAAAVDPAVRKAVEPGFDAAYYLQANPDVAAAGEDPLTHFLTRGWRQQRNPNLDFDTAYYLSAYPDVAEAKINPYYHYLVSGIDEGRLTTKPRARERQIIAAARPPRERLIDWLRSDTHKVPMSRAVLEKLMSELLPRHRRRWAISVSHDEYLRIAGGVQNCIADEQASLNKEAWSYLHLSPAQPLPLLSDASDPKQFVFTVSIDGERAGCAVASDLLEVLRLLLARGSVEVSLLIHSLLGNSPEILREFARLPQTTTVFWVHDFFSLCPSYALLRNDVEFCGAPPLQSNACAICVYGEERQSHWQRVRLFFEETRPRVLAPSAAALGLWKKAGFAHQDAHVAPHVKLLPADQAPRRQPAREPIRVAFVGGPVTHKGWHVYQELVRRTAKLNRFRYYHFGTPDLQASNIKHVDVRVSPGQRSAMVDALRAAEIDIVVNWSLCFETFSFTTYEALAAGAFVVARRGAGNIDAIIGEFGSGCLLDGETELFRAFESGEIVERHAAALARGLTSGEIVVQDVLPLLAARSAQHA
jgi:hypothetical protein